MLRVQVCKLCMETEKKTEIFLFLLLFNIGFIVGVSDYFLTRSSVCCKLNRMINCSRIINSIHVRRATRMLHKPLAVHTLHHMELNSRTPFILCHCMNLTIHKKRIETATQPWIVKKPSKKCRKIYERVKNVRKYFLKKRSKKDESEFEEEFYFSFVVYFLSLVYFHFCLLKFWWFPVS